jgi:hypothetical protein
MGHALVLAAAQALAQLLQELPAQTLAPTPST